MLHTEEIEVSGINPRVYKSKRASSSVLPGQSGKAGGLYGVGWLPSQKRRPEYGSEITHRTLDRDWIPLRILATNYNAHSICKPQEEPRKRGACPEYS